THRDDQAAALRRRLVDNPGLVPRLALHSLADTSRQIRAAELLAALPPAAAIAPMRDLLRQPVHPRAKLLAVESLLAAGHRQEQLQGLVPRAVLELAQQRRAAPTRWRSVRDPRQ